jgi:hypothetical protein
MPRNFAASVVMTCVDVTSTINEEWLFEPHRSHSDPVVGSGFKLQVFLSRMNFKTLEDRCEEHILLHAVGQLLQQFSPLRAFWSNSRVLNQGLYLGLAHPAKQSTAWDAGWWKSRRVHSGAVSTRWPGSAQLAGGWLIFSGTKSAGSFTELPNPQFRVAVQTARSTTSTVPLIPTSLQ